MATSVQLRNPGWCDGLTLAAQDIRLVDISALLSGAAGSSTNQLGIGSGARPGANNPLKVSAATGLSVTVNPGFALVQGSASANQGTYAACLDAAATLTCATADSVNPRIDAVCVTVTDNGDATSKAVVQVITGTPAASPTAPALPANSTKLAEVTVAQNATSLSSGNIADKRAFAVAAGGIKPVLNSSMYPSAGQGAAGDFYYNLATGRLVVFNGTACVAPEVAAFATVFGPSNTITASNVTETVSSVNVTVDGSTSVELTLKWSYITTAGTSAGTGVLVSAVRGSTAVDSIVKFCTWADSPIDGGSVIVEDQLPAAGTYTYSFQIVNQGAGTFQFHAGMITAKAVPA